jgi:hypothetical protein
MEEQGWEPQTHGGVGEALPGPTAVWRMLHVETEVHASLQV